MHVITAGFTAIAGIFVISKLTRRGKGKSPSKPAVESTSQLPTIEEQEPSSDTIEATPNHKRRASGEIPAAEPQEKEHKIKAMKVKEEALPVAPPASPLVLNPEGSEPAEQADEAVSIPSPPRPIATPPAATDTISSEFAADSTKESLFDELESQADSEASSLSRNGSLKRLGSKVKGQFRKLSSRSSKGSIQ